MQGWTVSLPFYLIWPFKVYKCHVAREEVKFSCCFFLIFPPVLLEEININQQYLPLFYKKFTNDIIKGVKIDCSASFSLPTLCLHLPPSFNFLSSVPLVGCLRHLVSGKIACWEWQPKQSTGYNCGLWKPPLYPMNRISAKPVEIYGHTDKKINFILEVEKFTGGKYCDNFIASEKCLRLQS